MPTSNGAAQDPNPIPLFFFEVFVLAVGLFMPACAAIFLIGLWIPNSALTTISGLGAMAWFVSISLSDLLKNLREAGRSDRTAERHGRVVASISLIWHVIVTYLAMPLAVTYVTRQFLPSAQAVFAGCIAESLFLYCIGRKRFLGSVFKFRSSAQTLRGTFTKLLIIEKAKTRSNQGRH
jgi:hypothetical protein